MGGLHSLPDRYEPLETLRDDTVETLWRCRDALLGREVLVKRPGPALREGPGAWSLREARALAAVRHPNVQRVLDVVDSDGPPWLVLEPVPGETLAERLAREGTLEPEQVRRLGADLARALEAVHATGAVHRDVAPENVVLRPDGAAVLCGFRLAKPTSSGPLTSLAYRRPADAMRAETSGVDLLPRFPAPEQVRGEAASPRSDLFGLGSLLYLALVGEEAIPELIERGWRAPANPVERAPGTPPELGRTILACLARTPSARPEGAGDLAARLEALAPSAQAAAVAREGGGRRLALLVAACLVVAVGGGLAWWRLAPRPALEAAGRGTALADAARRAKRGEPYAPRFDASRALLIGIGNEYARNGFPPLPNAEGDARALAERLGELRRYPWQVKTLLGAAATREAILGELARLERESGRDDRVLVYYAGHGVRHERTEESAWLVPADGETEETDPSRSHWIRFDELGRFLEETAAKHALVALDCCYSGRLATATRAAVSRRYANAFLTQRARVVLASGRPNEQVSDGSIGGHSPFASGFLHALEGDRPVTSSEVYVRILREVVDHGIGQQPLQAHPGSEPGEFVFFPG